MESPPWSVQLASLSTAETLKCRIHPALLFYCRPMGRLRNSSQQSSQQSSHDDDSSRFLSPRVRDESTASNSNRSTPACSPILRKRSRSPTPQNQDGDTMVEKGSDHSSDKSPSTPEQGVQRSCSTQSGRSGGKNSKVSRPCWMETWYPLLA